MSYKWRVVFLMMLFTFLDVIPFMGVQVMLKSIGEDYNSSPSDTAWVFLILFLAMAGSMVPGAYLGDTLGHKRAALFGLYGEALTLLLIPFAPNLISLVLLRFLQGIPRGFSLPNMQAIAVSAFSASERGRAIGIIASISGITTIFVPWVTGEMTDAWGWRWVFLFSTATVVGLGLLVQLVVPDESSREENRFRLGDFDWLGSLLLMLTVGAFLAGIQFVSKAGNTLLGASLIFTALVLAVVFVRLENRLEHPTLPLTLFKNRAFSVASAQNVLFNFVNGVNVFLMPTFFQYGLGWSAASAGRMIVFTGLPRAPIALTSGFLSDRFGVTPLVFAGTFLVTLGGLGMALGGSSGAMVMIAPFLVLFGLGQALFMTPNSRRLYDTMPPGQMAMASGTQGLGRHVGQTSGIGIASAFLGILAGGTSTTVVAGDVIDAFRMITLGAAIFFALAVTASFAGPAAWRILKPRKAGGSAVKPPFGG